MEEKEKLKLGVFNAIAMITTNSVLKLLSYPTLVLAKSSKILSVMLVSFIYGGKRHKII